MSIREAIKFLQGQDYIIEVSRSGKFFYLARNYSNQQDQVKTKKQVISLANGIKKNLDQFKVRDNRY